MARNARFTLSPEHLQLIATGKVAPAIDWQVPVAPGAPRPQRRDHDTGLPLWVVDCLDEGDPEAGRANVVAVEVPADVEPAPTKYRPLEFAGPVVCSLYVAKSGQLNMTYAGTLKLAAARTATAA